jgi:hypothetical protein
VQLAKKRDALIGINPSFKNDTNIVMVPPNEAASANGDKVIEGDVELSRKKSQSV